MIYFLPFLQFQTRNMSSPKDSKHAYQICAVSSLVYLSHECFHVPHPITHVLSGPTGRSSLAGPIAHTMEAQPLPNHVLCNST